MRKSMMGFAAGMFTAAFVVAAPVQAEMPDGVGDEAVVRVVNYNKADVRVFAFDSDGRRTLLGVVGSGDFKELEIDQLLIQKGAVQVKVYPVGSIAGLGSRSEAGNGVKSSKLHLNSGDIVDVWVEPDLDETMVRITRG